MELRLNLFSRGKIQPILSEEDIEFFRVSIAILWGPPEKIQNFKTDQF